MVAVSSMMIFVGKRGDEMDACVVLADDLEFGLRDIARGLGTEVELRHNDDDFRVGRQRVIGHSIRLLQALGMVSAAERGSDWFVLIGHPRPACSGSPGCGRSIDFEGDGLWFATSKNPEAEGG